MTVNDIEDLDEIRLHLSFLTIAYARVLFIANEPNIIKKMKISTMTIRFEVDCIPSFIHMQTCA